MIQVFDKLLFLVLFNLDDMITFDSQQSHSCFEAFQEANRCLEKKFLAICVLV
jgi:hypothetical protein